MYIGYVCVPVVLGSTSTVKEVTEPSIEISRLLLVLSFNVTDTAGGGHDQPVDVSELSHVATQVLLDTSGIKRNPKDPEP